MTKLDEIKNLEKQGYKIDGVNWVSDVSLTVNLIKKTNKDMGKRETVYIPSSVVEFDEVFRYVMEKSCK